MFAFAILDARRNEIHLARDRFGIKPLYWTNTPEGFAFASELRALLASLRTSTCDVDLSAFSRYLCFYYVPSPHSMVRGVRARARPRLDLSRGRVTEHAYWRATDHLGRARPAAGFARERFEDELDGLLADTVQRPL